MRVYGLRLRSGFVHFYGLDRETEARVAAARGPLAADWTAPAARVVRVEQYTGERLRDADLLACGSGHLALSEAAVAAVGDLFCRDGELLPLAGDLAPGFLYHPLGDEDAFDPAATAVLLRGADRVALADLPPEARKHGVAERVAFRPDRLAGRAVVDGIGYRPWACFLTEPAAERLLAAGLRGVVLEPVWEDDAPASPVGPPTTPIPAVRPPAPPPADVRLAKVLVGGRSVTDPAFIWPLPGPDGRPGAWVATAGAPDPGRNGLHLLAGDPYTAWPVWGMAAYAAEAGADALARDGVVASSRARLLCELPPPAWWARGVDFVRRELPAVPWFVPKGPPPPEWHVTVGDEDSSELYRRSRAAMARADHEEEALAGWRLEEIAAAAGRGEAAAVHWGTAFRATVDPLLTLGPTPNADLVAATDEIGEFAADLCLLRGVLHDQPVPAGWRAQHEATWAAYARGYVPVGYAGGRLYIVTRPWER